MLSSSGWVVYVWSANGYRLEDRDGDAPRPGELVTIGDTRYEVESVGSSPLPGDHRPCAFVIARP
jgi:hypothetical protein